MSEARLLSLVEALRILPGVGVKSAQRMAFHLLQHDRDGGCVWAMKVPSGWREVGRAW